MSLNISERMFLGMISFSPFSKTPMQRDTSSQKFQYGLHTVGTSALLFDHPV